MIDNEQVVKFLNDHPGYKNRGSLTILKRLDRYFQMSPLDSGRRKIIQELADLFSIPAEFLDKADEFLWAMKCFLERMVAMEEQQIKVGDTIQDICCGGHTEGDTAEVLEINPDLFLLVRTHEGSNHIWSPVNCLKISTILQKAA